MSKVIHEIKVRLTKVVEVPDDFPEQISYDCLHSGDYIREHGDRVPKKAVYSLYAAISPLISNFDKVDIDKMQMFVTEEDKHDDSGEEKESMGDVPVDGLAQKSGANA